VNRIGRPGPLEGGSSEGRIVLAAEITAVADVYVALSARGPHRPALPAGVAAAVLRRMAGRQLNQEVVAAMLELVGIYPLGAAVVVTSGPFAGWRGVVSRVHPAQPDRPTVRLLRGPRGEAVAARELDLRRADAGLAPLATAAWAAPAAA
jgi:hypothetical protein